jgi:uncharacterized phage protein gp47/JayE
MTFPSTYDSTGISMAVYDDILNAMVALAEAWKGDSISVDEKELLGHILRQVSNVVRTCNENIQDIYDSRSVLNAVGTNLDHLLALIFPEGRQSAAPSTATVTCTVTKATTIPAGSLVKTEANVYFETDEELVFVGAGSDDVGCTCTENGPNNAAIGEINTIVSSAPGWTVVTNAAAAIPGRLQESNAAYKARHTLAVSTTGLSDLASYYEAVGAVSGVSDVLVEDDDDTNEVYVVVIGGSDADVVDAIGTTLIGGIGTTGSESGVFNDPVTGGSKTVYFDRADGVGCYVRVDVTTDLNFPADGEQQIKNAIVSLFGELTIGDDVIYTALYRPIWGIAGVVTVDILYLDTSSPPTGTSNLTISTTQKAIIDEDDITVNVS